MQENVFAGDKDGFGMPVAETDIALSDAVDILDSAP